MKMILAKIGRAFGAFFKSILDDLTQGFRRHWLKMVGYVIMFFVPLGFLVHAYIERTPSEWAMPTFVWIPTVVFLFVYWGKLRRYMAIKISQMEVENNIQKGKHAGAIICFKTVQVVNTVLPFYLGYVVFDELQKKMVSIRDIFLFMTICQAAGGLLIILDTIANVIDYSEEKNDEVG